MRALNDLVDLKEELGRGWAGQVFRGTLTRAQYGFRPGDRVAVKRFRPHIFVDAGELIRARIEREFLVGSHRFDARIVRTYELVDAKDENGFQTLALIMEFIDGVSLDKHIGDHFPLAAGEILQIAVDVTRALSALHGEGIVHRDVKPQNIMVEGGRATLMDMGVVKAPLLDAASLTGSAEFLGTIRYAEKEALFQGVDDELADAWSLGMTLFHVLYGKPPYFPMDRFPQWIRAIDEDLCSLPTSSDRFGVPPTPDHLFVESILSAIVRPRAERIPLSRVAGQMSDRDSCEYYLAHLETLGKRILEGKYVKYPWTVFVPYALYRVRTQLGRLGLEQLAQLTGYDDINANKELGELVAVKYPLVRDYRGLPPPIRRWIGSEAAHYLNERALDPAFRDAYGGILFPDLYFEKIAKEEDDPELKAHFEKLAEGCRFHDHLF